MYTNPEMHPIDPQGEFHLRPLSVGEVFDRTFSLYRRHFVLFLGIALLPAAVSLLSGITRLLILHAFHLSQLTPASRSLPLASSTFLWSLISLAAYGISQAATTAAISDIYLEKPTSAKVAYGRGSQHWFRYSLLAFLQVLWASWISILVLIAVFAAVGSAVALRVLPPVVMGVIAVLAILAILPFWLFRFAKISLAMPAAVIEHLKIRASMKRSKHLMAERKWRVVLLFLLIAFLYLLIGSLVGITNIFAQKGDLHLVVAQCVQLLVTFFAALLLQPIGAMGVCLFYFDERVRQEGFDIEFMMQREDPDSSFPVEDALGA